MAFKEVTGFNTIDIKKNGIGKAYTGLYVGSKEITTKMGNQIIYNFESQNGNFGIYGFSWLNSAMNGVKHNMLCRITYLGTEKMQTKFGIKDVHKCKVEIDEEYKPNNSNINEDVPFEPELENDPFDGTETK